MIKDIKDGESVSLKLLVSNVTKGVSNNNATYLSITLQDNTGTIEAKRWDATAADIEFFQTGKIAHIVGEANLYRNNMQLKIMSFEDVDVNSIDYKDYVMSAPVSVELLEEELNEYINSIKNEECAQIVRFLTNKHYKALLTHPAAVRNHHEYCSGLLYHTVSMARVANLLAEFYGCDRDLLLSGVLLHDLGKTIELSGPIAPKYTLEGKLIGHISIMQSEIRECAENLKIAGEIPLLLEHMILSHHGKYEFGSPVLPLTKEALLLNIIDDLDAKMTILDKALATVNDGEFTQKIFALDERMFYKPIKK